MTHIMEKIKGNLYIVPTPIGNLEDMTLRSLRILKEADIVLCEDTRRTLALLNHYDLKKKLLSYHEHNEKMRVDEIINMIYEGMEVALVSDAGMPGISDPGHVIIKACIEHGLNVEVLPGATATITALVLSGLNTDRFTFLGFIPRENKYRNEFLRELEEINHTSIVYESVHRILSTLKLFSEKFPDRKIAVCRELTKIHQEINRGTCLEVYEYYKNKENIKGEFVIILEKAEKEEKEIDIEQLLKIELSKGKRKKEAVKYIVKEYGLNRNDVYQKSLEIDGDF